MDLAPKVFIAADLQGRTPVALANGVFVIDHNGLSIILLTKGVIAAVLVPLDLRLPSMPPRSPPSITTGADQAPAGDGIRVFGNGDD